MRLIDADSLKEQVWDKYCNSVQLWNSQGKEAEIKWAIWGQVEQLIDLQPTIKEEE